LSTPVSPFVLIEFEDRSAGALRWNRNAFENEDIFLTSSALKSIT
jgi:hypothetical protein